MQPAEGCVARGASERRRLPRERGVPNRQPRASLPIGLAHCEHALYQARHARLRTRCGSRAAWVSLASRACNVWRQRNIFCHPVLRCRVKAPLAAPVAYPLVAACLSAQTTGMTSTARTPRAWRAATTSLRLRSRVAPAPLPVDTARLRRRPESFRRRLGTTRLPTSATTTLCSEGR